MRLEHLDLENFRNFAAAAVEVPVDGATLVRGANGQGKTSLLEAVSLLATVSSFRGADAATMVRDGQARAAVHAVLVDPPVAGRDLPPGSAAGSPPGPGDGPPGLLSAARGVQPGRRLDVEVRLDRNDRTRVLRNGNVVKRHSEVAGELRTVVFSPDDLDLVKGAPSARRRFLDDALVALDPRHGETVAAFERALRQRSSLLRQQGGRLTVDGAATLDVWDERVAAFGSALAAARRALVSDLGEPVTGVYNDLSGEPGTVALDYESSWDGDLREALAAARELDVRTGSSHVGPQRDELAITLRGSPSRSHGSQGEQRCLALALRLGVHRLATRPGAPGGEPGPDSPVLILDDVFSELDARRSDVLAAILPPGQVLISAAGDVPAALTPAAVLTVRGGTVCGGTDRGGRVCEGTVS